MENIQEQRLIKSFHGRIIGNRKTKQMIARTLLLLPEDVRQQLSETTWFLSTPHETFGFVLSAKDIGERNVIYLSDELFKESLPQVHYTILHEIGHVILGHRNAFHAVQTDSEIEKQEKEADEFAVQYLRIGR